MLSTGKKKGKSKQQQQQQSSPSGAAGAAAVGVDGTSNGSSAGVEQGSSVVKIALNFKRYLFDPNKRMIQ